MPTMILCGACDGRRFVNYEKCPACEGMGNLPDNTGRDNLAAVLDDELAGSSLGAVVLEVLAENRSELVAWLREIDVLRTTRYALVEKRELDGWGHAGPPELVPVPANDGTPPERRLWTVKP